MGQGDGNPVLLVPQPNGLGKFHLLDNFGRQRLGEGNCPIFAALGPDEKETGLLLVTSLIRRLRGSVTRKAATIN